MRQLFKIRIGNERDLRRGDVKFQQVELRVDFHALTQLCRGDAEQHWNEGIATDIVVRLHETACQNGPAGRSIET